MSKATASDRIAFAVRLQKEFPKVQSIDTIAARIMRLGASYGNLQETACNRDLSEREQKRESAIENELRDICAKLNSGIKVECSPEGLGRADWELIDSGQGEQVKGRCFPVFSGDTRGITVKIHVPSGFSTGWGREGICVPTA